MADTINQQITQKLGVDEKDLSYSEYGAFVKVNGEWYSYTVYLDENCVVKKLTNRDLVVKELHDYVSEEYAANHDIDYDQHHVTMEAYKKHDTSYSFYIKADLTIAVKAYYTDGTVKGAYVNLEELKRDFT